MKMLVVRAGILLFLSIGVAGCGGSHSRKRVSGTYILGSNGVMRRIATSPVKYLPNGLRVLVREPMLGGYFAIVAKRYEYLGHTYSVMDDREEGAGDRGGGGGGSLDIEPGQRIPLEIAVFHVCLGSYAHAVAYGMLRDPNDSVTAEVHGTTTIFKKLAIPANFRPDGLLVYALLRQGPANIAVRTGSGQVVSSESYTLESATC
jgi:hypothetical protein